MAALMEVYQHSASGNCRIHYCSYPIRKRGW